MYGETYEIFFGDLTYTTISLATDAFPLNIGYVASYCKTKFGMSLPTQELKSYLPTH